MKSHKRILIAFFLNLLFSAVEFIGGIFTGSVAIISDAVHDFGDSISIGISFFLEKISKKKPDNSHTYGYVRYSVLGSIITTVILIIGSVLVILNAMPKLIRPESINYNGMLAFAVFGVVVNFIAAVYTHGGGSLNQKAVNLHMLEDVLGWVIVLVGALVIKLTNAFIIDPILSIAVAVFIFINALKNLKSTLDIFLEKTPSGVDIEELKEHIREIDGVEDVHHIHIRSIDGFTNYATMHIVTDADAKTVKKEVKDELKEHGIAHTTVEIEGSDEVCEEIYCNPEISEKTGHHHHHHHHH